MKVLVTGANGQLGQTIQKHFSGIDNDINFEFVSKNELDITDQESVNDIFRRGEFEYCINCAAYTNVDGAEDERDLAFKINYKGVKNVASACNEYNTVLIHISTDYVFNGKFKVPYKHSDKTDPINAYGASKLAGELAIQKTLSRYFIVRTSWLYSPYGKNFVKTIVEKVRNNNDLKIVTSQLGCPTSCLDLAEFVTKIISTKNQDFGVYHFCSLGETTWYGLARQISSHFKDYHQEKLKPIDSYPTKANRPNYSVLNTEKASKIIQLHQWQDSVDKVVLLLK